MAVRFVALSAGADHAGFRSATRWLIANAIAPSDVAWSAGSGTSLFDAVPLTDAPKLLLPRVVADMIEPVACHRDPERYSLLYSLVWRVLHGERALPEVATDPLVHRLTMMKKAIRRDLHKMHAFLRFRRLELPDGTDRFVAWFEPDHFILDATADFFVERFRAVRWSIVTPIGSLHWHDGTLTSGPPGTRADVPVSDPFEAGWCGYYESTFNPARSNPTAMRAEMPKKYWRNMPEAALIPDLIRSADERVRAMIAREARGSCKRDPAKAVAAMKATGASRGA